MKYHIDFERIKQIIYKSIKISFGTSQNINGEELLLILNIPNLEERLEKMSRKSSTQIINNKS